MVQRRKRRSAEFDNPLCAVHFEARSGGTRSTGTSVGPDVRITVGDLRLGARFVGRLEPLLRDPVTLAEARATLRRRLDVPFGLVVVRALADLVGAATPQIDEVIAWAQEKLGRQYLVDGRLRGRDVPALRIPQNHGIRTVRALVEALA